MPKWKESEVSPQRQAQTQVNLPKHHPQNDKEGGRVHRQVHFHTNQCSFPFIIQSSLPQPPPKKVKLDDLTSCQPSLASGNRNQPGGSKPRDHKAQEGPRRLLVSPPKLQASQPYERPGLETLKFASSSPGSETIRDETRAATRNISQPTRKPSSGRVQQDQRRWAERTCSRDLADYYEKIWGPSDGNGHQNGRSSENQVASQLSSTSSP